MKEERSVKNEGEAAASSPGYRDIPLYSTDCRSLTTHLMKFAHHNRIDPNDTQQFIPPVKLNRKMPLRVKQAPAKAGDIVIDKWGKPIITTEGKPLKWPGPNDDLEAYRPFMDLDKKSDDENDVAPGSGHASQGRLFKKRVREVHKSANAARRTRNEEFYPWVLEDFETSNDWESSRNPAANSIQALEAYYVMEQERRARAAAAGMEDVKPIKAEIKTETNPTAPAHAPWIGQLEGESDENSLSHHVLFAFDERNAGGFKVIPIRRQYKFMQSQRPILDSEEVEEEFQKYQRSSESERLAMRSRLQSGSKSGQASQGAPRRFPTLALPRGPSLGWDSSQRLVAVRGENRDRDPEDDMYVVPKRETTYDELDFEESFADDEERPDTVLDEDQEAKELEERIKREMVADHVDDDVQIKREPDEMDDAVMVNRRSGADGLMENNRGIHDNALLTSSGRQMRNIMKALSRREGNDIYDSDEEAKNPYASDESEDEENLDVLHPERAIMEAREERAKQERLAKESAAQTATASVPSSPRSESAAMPIQSGEESLKRKGESKKDSTQKRAKTNESSSRASSPGRSMSPLESEIAQLIRDGKVQGTAALVQHFRQRLKNDPSLKEQLSLAVKKIAYMDKKSNQLKLKEGF
ncbi:transcription factor IIF subunit tfg1 [Malassezia psittaci]|uniref:Transcription factor IIF subunit tfg1 n=1 Tax=Malassezia psittaci TaxID=1821823 RepID=A0AAF0F800_9BASI|nr:transcription factor IIF subunit tfg1 [Malassezia psittaci]